MPGGVIAIAVRKRGSFIARIERNPESLHPRMAELARLCGVVVVAANSAYADIGDTGIGSEAVTSHSISRRPFVILFCNSLSASHWPSAARRA